MNDSARPKKSRGLLALSPLAVFLCLYLGTSLAAGLASVSPLEIIGYLYYPMALGICSLLAILLRYPRKYS